MEEIAKTFDDNNLSEKLFNGVAETYMFVEKSILGEEIVEKRTKGKTAEDVTDILASFVSKN